MKDGDVDDKLDSFLKSRVMVGTNLQQAVDKLEWASKYESEGSTTSCVACSVGTLLANACLPMHLHA